MPPFRLQNGKAILTASNASGSTGAMRAQQGGPQSPQSSPAVGRRGLEGSGPRVPKPQGEAAGGRQDPSGRRSAPLKAAARRNGVPSA